MDQILFPYNNKLQVSLIKKKKIGTKAHLVLSDSLFVINNKTFQDEGYLNDEKIDYVYESSSSLYHVVSADLNETSYTMTIDYKKRLANMKNYLAERILVLIFKRLFSINLKDKSKQVLIFSRAGRENIDQILAVVNETANHIVSLGLDVKTFFNKGKYYGQIPSLGLSQISYPLAANTGELGYIDLDFQVTEDLIRVKYKCANDLIDDYHIIRASYKDLENLNPQGNAKGNYQGLIQENKDLKKDLETTKEAYYKSYARSLVKVKDLGSYSLVNHLIEDDSIDEMARLISKIDAEIILLTKSHKTKANFVLANLTTIDMYAILTRIKEVYPLDIIDRSSYIRGLVDPTYLNRFRDIFEKELGKETLIYTDKSVK